MPELRKEQVWEILEAVKDPEIPVVSVVEMGLIREVRLEQAAQEGVRVEVTLTPTFSGCPAIGVMQEEIRTRLRQAGAAEVEVRLTLSPPWTSDWITPEAREKLRLFGLAPPPQHGGKIDLALIDVVTCPYCGSQDTRLQNSFGSTLCRAIFTCNTCRQPFEQFKPV